MSKTIFRLATILDPHLKSAPFRNQSNYRHRVQELKNEVSAMIKAKTGVNEETLTTALAPSQDLSSQNESSSSKL